jgi:hypothetical protein
MAWR